jgi:hypothetical protein
VRGLRQAGRLPVVRRVRRRRRLGAVLTWADRLTLYALVGLAVGLMLVPQRGGGAAASIEGTDGFSLTVPLSEDGEYAVPGPLGRTMVSVSKGAVRVDSSPCPHQVCVGMGAVARSGEVIVCVPNGVVVRVLGQAGRALHATTR